MSNFKRYVSFWSHFFSIFIWSFDLLKEICKKFYANYLNFHVFETWFPTRKAYRPNFGTILCVCASVCLDFVFIPLQVPGISIISALQAFVFTIHKYVQKEIICMFDRFFSMSNGICDDFYFKIPNKDKLVCWLLFFCCCFNFVAYAYIWIRAYLVSGKLHFIMPLQLDLLKVKKNTRIRLRKQH